MRKRIWSIVLCITLLFMSIPFSVSVDAAIFETTPMVAAGGKHTVALKTDGTVWVWGANDCGQLGYKTPSDYGQMRNNYTPSQVAGVSKIKDIAAGSVHTVALKNDGTVWAWGYNFTGKVGNEIGEMYASEKPIQIPQLSGITAIATGNYHTVALKNDGTVWAWGSNSYGQVGNGKYESFCKTPTQIANLTNVIAISAGSEFTFALKSDGTVWAWGRSQSGLLGTGTSGSQSTPVFVQGLSNIKAISAGGYNNVAVIRNDDTVWKWKETNREQVSGTWIYSYNLVQIPVLSNVSSVSAGSSHTVVLKKDGTVWVWGANTSGQLGDGTTANRETPIQIDGIDNIVSVATGPTHTVAIKNDGAVWAWGRLFYDWGGVYTLNPLKQQIDLNEIIISYDANGGSGAPSRQTKTKGVSLTLNAGVPTRAGEYTFLGWATTSTATTAQYQPGNTFTIDTSTVLFAVWETISYEIAYDANGGSGAPLSQRKVYDETLTLSSIIPTRTGYTFLGWSTNQNATTASYTSGGKYTNNADATLYAVWKLITYKVTYNVNGGNGAPSSQTKLYNQNLTLSAIAPTKVGGHDFIGWSTEATATTAKYQSGDVFSINADTVLYAIWKDAVSCNSCDGTGKEFALKDGICSYCSGNGTITTTCFSCGGSGYSGEWVVILGIPVPLFCAECMGSGRGTYGCGTCNGTGVVKATTQVPCKTCGGNGTATGATYTIAYDANGGTGVPSKQTKSYGHAITLSSVVPTRIGHTFLGWAMSASATTVACSPGEIYTSDSAITLYAVWKASTYSVTYNANGGIGAPASQTKSYDVSLTLSSTVPTRAGHTFLGWSTSGTTTTATYSAGGSYTANVAATLYAVWEPNTYTISYNANGGTGAPGSQTKTYGQTLTLSSTIPTRTNYTFLGWSTSNTATTATYSSGDSYTANEAATLYAVWKLNTVTLTYIAVTTKPGKLSYIEGELLNTAGMVVTAYYDNGTSAVVSGGITTRYDFSTTGTKTVTVEYGGKSTTFTVMVTAKSVNSISMKSQPTKRTYTQGEVLNVSGAVIAVIYNNNTNTDVTVTTAMCSGYSTSKTGTQTITVTYQGKTTTFTVTVQAPPVTVPSSISSSTFTVSGGNISKVTADTTVTQLLNGINEKAYVKVYKGSSEVSGSTKLGTGMTVRLMDGSTIKQTVAIIVTGDTNGDGDITITDMLAVKSHLLGMTTLSGAPAKAADTNGDSDISITDFIQIKAHVLGKEAVKGRAL